MEVVGYADVIDAYQTAFLSAQFTPKDIAYCALKQFSNAFMAERRHGVLII
jgi:hypothetical protein